MDEHKKQDEDINNEPQNESCECCNDGEMEDMQDKLAGLEKEAQDNLAGWQRAKADFLNYKRDQEKIFAEFKSFANEDIVLKLLPTVDSFELATKHLPEELKSSDWAKGIMCIKGLFENFLKEIGVNEIKALGEKFDPNLFEAVAEEESEAEEGFVIEEIQKGYRLGERLIRPAKVKISKGKIS
jgi:molecular chaperone GrpE